MKQKCKLLIWFVGGMSLLLSVSCRKENEEPVIEKKAAWGIYMAGKAADTQKKSYSVNGNSLGCIWVNGKQYDLGEDIWVSDVKVFNDTIYACGRNSLDRNTAFYFINERKYNFNISRPGSDIYNLWVEGNKVYVAGQDSSKPCYWVNGIKHNLPSDGTGGSANDIIIKNNNIYCAGNRTPYYMRGCYWINDQRYDLEDLRPRGGNNSWASGLFVDEPDVYISGTVDGDLGFSEACYWKNGVRQSLSFLNMGYVHNTLHGSIRISEADDIYIHNGDIYVSGRYFFGDEKIYYTALEMCYWKNSERTDVEFFQEPFRPKIVADDTAAYFIAGTSFWINNRQVPIDNQQNFTISSIYLYEAPLVSGNR